MGEACGKRTSTYCLILILILIFIDLYNTPFIRWMGGL
jgi:hypothetical protein